MLDKKIEAMQTFQLTPSRRATDAPAKQLRLWSISTHALTEGDGTDYRLNLIYQNFNSRPHGGRLRRYTSQPHNSISTHALTEGDLADTDVGNTLVDFNSRPHGGRPQI